MNITHHNSYALPEGTTLHGKNGDYWILRQLGEGGAGITYLAEAKNTGEKVAVKEFFMKDRSGRSGTHVTNSSTDGNFEKYKTKHINEARKLMDLGGKHNIIRVTDLFEANNTAYYVMEYIEGGNLSDYIKRKGKLPPEEATNLILQIADSVSFMHSQKMLHLDIKPKNVMLRNEGTPILIDFGLSKVYDDNGEPESTTSIAGFTDGYSPNEQASYRDGKGFPVTMDIYALGATLFHMVTGTKPPSASDVMNLHEDFLEELRNANVPDVLQKCIDKAMASLVKNRYQTVEQFVQDLPRPKRQTKKKKGIKDEVTVIDISESINSIIEKADSIKFKFEHNKKEYLFQANSTESSSCLETSFSGVKDCTYREFDYDELSAFKQNIVPKLKLVITERSPKIGNREIRFYDKRHRILTTAISTLPGQKIFDLLYAQYLPFKQLHNQMGLKRNTFKLSEEPFCVSFLYLSALEKYRYEFYEDKVEVTTNDSSKSYIIDNKDFVPLKEMLSSFRLEYDKDMFEYDDDIFYFEISEYELSKGEQRYYIFDNPLEDSEKVYYAISKQGEHVDGNLFSETPLNLDQELRPRLDLLIKEREKKKYFSFANLLWSLLVGAVSFMYAHYEGAHLKNGFEILVLVVIGFFAILTILKALNTIWKRYFD